MNYINFILDMLIIFLWGWGILYALSKITKYKNMFIGFIGCLGMFSYHLYDSLSRIPNELIIIFPNFEKAIDYKNQMVNLWQTNNIDNYYIFALLFFQICIVAAISGRFKMEKAIIEQKSDKIPEESPDNDLDYSTHSQSEYEDDSYIPGLETNENESYEDSSENESYEDSSENESYEDSSENETYEDSKEYIEVNAYTESEASQPENYIAVDAYDTNSGSEYEESSVADEEFFEQEDDPLAYDKKEIPQTQVNNAPNIDESEKDKISRISRVQTVTDDNIIPQTRISQLGPEIDDEDDRVPTFDSKQLFIPKEPEEEAIEATISCNMEELASSSQVAIPMSPDEEVEATIACNMDELVKDDEYVPIDSDDTFANLGNDDQEGVEVDDPDPRYQQKSDNKAKPEEEQRSLLRNLLPPNKKNK